MEDLIFLKNGRTPHNLKMEEDPPKNNAILTNSITGKLTITKTNILAQFKNQPYLAVT